MRNTSSWSHWPASARPSTAADRRGHPSFDCDFPCHRTLLAYSGSCCQAEMESLEVACAGPVQGCPGPPGVQPDQVDGDGGDVVLEGGFGQAEVSGAADAGDVGG